MADTESLLTVGGDRTTGQSVRTQNGTQSIIKSHPLSIFDFITAFLQSLYFGYSHVIDAACKTHGLELSVFMATGGGSAKKKECLSACSCTKLKNVWYAI